jgi:hypothetical protein
MGALADKMLSAGLVSEEDVKRVKRQQTIEKENKRKEDCRKEKEAQNRAVLSEARAMATRKALREILLYLGVDEVLMASFFGNEKDRLAALALLGSQSKSIMEILNSDPVKKEIEKVAQEAAKDETFRRSVGRL